MRGVPFLCAGGRQEQPDIIWVGHEKPGSIGVDDIRDQLVSDMQIKPYSSPYKIYIIDEADKLTVAAQNAMLKTIEEPPAYGIVILLANNPDVFLQTILSRCVVLDLKPLKDDVVIKYLTDHYDNIGDYECKFAARFAAGRIGRAMTLVESTEFAELRRDVMDVIKNAKDMDSADIMASVKRVANYKLTIDDYLDLMLMWYRDVLMFKSTNDTNLLIFNDQMTLIRVRHRLCHMKVYRILLILLTGLRSDFRQMLILIWLLNCLLWRLRKIHRMESIDD